MPDSDAHSPREKDKEGGHKRHKDKVGDYKERVGDYVVQGEVGRGTFATVYKAYKAKKLSPDETRPKEKRPVAIKAVYRKKLTAKLQENLESEINILKMVKHRNIVALEDCFKSDQFIYLVMEYCTGSDLSFYLKQRGQLPTLDFMPKPSSSMELLPRNADGMVWWPHPPSGGLDERVTRSFLGQLATALMFLRAQDLMHRDIKPQNLLLQPATEQEVADGHPYGIPVLKVADFGFARILPAAAMAETLCGSPLYMAPEILRYEKYDAKADLWSVGAVLFEMAVGRPPFRASNHVELLRRIEKGNDNIVFSDEKPPSSDPAKADVPPPAPVPPDIKALIRALLKRKPADRMDFDDFFACGVWDAHMIDSSTEEGSMSLEASTSSSSAAGGILGDSDRIRQMVASMEQGKERVVARRAPMAIAADPALNPQPAPRASRLEEHERATLAAQRTPTSRVSTPPAAHHASPRPTPPRRSEPKYYVGDSRAPDLPLASPITSTTTTPTPAAPAPSSMTGSSAAPSSYNARANPRPIMTTAQRRLSGRTDRDPGSVEEAAPLTPPYTGPSPTFPRARVGEGSPLATAPPLTMRPDGKVERDNAMDSSGSGVGTDYVVVEKQTVEINALADELDQASKRPVVRRSSRGSVVSRPVSSFKPISPASRQESGGVGPVSYSPPFSLSSTPPFAITQANRPSSGTTVVRPPSIPHSLNIFPPSTVSVSPDTAARFGVSPQPAALARTLTTNAMRLVGTSVNSAATALARATAKRRPTIIRTNAIDPAEDELLCAVEDIARKAFVLFELADERLLAQSQLAATARTTHASTPTGLIGTTPPFSAQAAANAANATTRRKSSSGSMNSEVWVLRQQEAAANDAVVLYMKSLAFIVQAMEKVKRWWKNRTDQYEAYVASQELNEMGQWLRARFNEIYEKAEWAKSRAGDNLLFPDWLVHDKARDLSRQSAVAELQGDLTTAEHGYETSLWLLQALLDESVYENGRIREDDRITYEKLMVPIKARLDSLRRKVSESSNPTATDTATRG